MKRAAIMTAALLCAYLFASCGVSLGSCDDLDPTCSTGSVLAFIPPAPVISNVVDGGVIETGFILGTAENADAVEVSINGGAYALATSTLRDDGRLDWTYKLPTGSGGLLKDVRYTIRARSTSVLTGLDASITARKGNNRDFNGDGYPDLVVGAGRANGTTGAVYIFHGSSAGISTTAAASANTILTGQAANDNFGEGFATGDFNGDGYADLVTGASLHDVPAVNRGIAYIFQSSGTSGIASGSATTATTTIASDMANQSFGRSMVAGDINGDGYSDTVIGVESSTAAGAYIFYGGANGISATVSTGADVLIAREATGDGFGVSLALADVNGDSYSDLMVTAPEKNSGAGGGQGATYVFHSSGGSGITVTNASAADTKIIGVAGGDYYSAGIAAGDVNGDGYFDMIVGGPFYSAGAEQGRVYVHLSRGTNGIASGSAAAADTIITGQAAGDLFGFSVGAGDLNGDGFADVITGSMKRNTYTGVAFVFYSSATGISATTYAEASVSFTAPATNYSMGYSGAVGDATGDGRADFISGAPGRFSGSTPGFVYIFQAGTSAGITATSLTDAAVTITGESNTDLFGQGLGTSHFSE